MYFGAGVVGPSSSRHSPDQRRGSIMASAGWVKLGAIVSRVSLGNEHLRLLLLKGQDPDVMAFATPRAVSFNLGTMPCAYACVALFPRLHVRSPSTNSDELRRHRFWQVAEHLGLDSCRVLPKRAIQFGSRIAQHCARHTHGSHRRGSGSDVASFVPYGGS